MIAVVAVAVVVTLALIAAGVTWAVIHLQRKQRRASLIWQQLAESRKGRFRPSQPSWWRHHPDNVEVVVEQAVVLLDTHLVPQGNSRAVYTRARAQFAATGGPRFRVYPEGVLSGLGKLLGTQDARLGGDPAFDEAFMVKCDDVEATRHAWTHRARRLLRTALPEARVESDGETVTAMVYGHLDDRARLDAILDLTAELASFGGRELVELAERLPGARFVGAAGPWDDPRRPRVEVETARGALRIASRPAIGGPRLELTLAHERELAPFSVDIDAGRLGAGAPRGLLPDAAVHLLDPIGAATLTGTAERVRLVFPNVPALDALRAGVELLVEVAGGHRSSGAFR